MKLDTTTLVVAVVAGLALVLLATRCASNRDHYMRADLGGVNTVHRRSPVDFAMKYYDLPTKREEGPEWEAGNPHFRTDPTSKWHQLEDGHVDLYRDERKLSTQGHLWPWSATGSGDEDMLWRQYEHNYLGAGKGNEYVVNDIRTRSLLGDEGEFDAKRVLDNARDPRMYGPSRGPLNLEIDYIQPDPWHVDERIYSGYVHRLGE